MRTRAVAEAIRECHSYSAEALPLVVMYEAISLFLAGHYALKGNAIQRRAGLLHFRACPDQTGGVRGVSQGILFFILDLTLILHQVLLYNQLTMKQLSVHLNPDYI